MIDRGAERGGGGPQDGEPRGRDSLSRPLEELRAETPGTRDRIHLNNAGAALMPAPVLDRVVEHLELESRIGGYEAAHARHAEIEEAYQAAAALLGANPSDIAFVENATDAVARALSSVPFRPGDVLLTTRHDYVSNQIMYLSLESRMGVEVVRAPDRKEGGVDPRAMGELIHRRRPRLVSLTHVPTGSGVVQPAEAVGEACRERGILYLVDACQSVGQMPVDVRELGADFVAATSRKFLRGPRGSGLLYVSPRVLDAGLEPLFPDLRGADWIEEDLYQPAMDARRFENWEFSYALILGTGEAARYATSLGLDAIRDRSWILAERLRAGLRTLPGVEVLDRGEVLSAIVTASLPGIDASEAVALLRARGINTSSVARGSALLDFDARGVESALRLSPHYYNTEDEVDQAVEALADAIAGRQTGADDR